MQPLSTLIIIAITVGIFLLCRELVCWYNKTNERIELQKKIIEKLEAIDEHIRQLKSE